jgi:Tfp pilus assembly PilM family ATPase
MDKENTVRGTILTVARRFAAGIDVSEDAVRVAVISRRIRPSLGICVEHLESVPLPEGAVVNGDFIDRQAISAALGEALGRLPERGTWRNLRCAMGMSHAATFTTCVPLLQLIAPNDARATVCASDPFGLLEPAVLAEAERATGIERGALAVDWSVLPQDTGRAQVSIAATQRRHVEARVETAAMAGVALASIDGEAAAALRAMRYIADTELGPDARYLVCWIERTGLQGWLVDTGDVESDARYPAPEYRSITEALRDLAGAHAPIEGIYVGGEIGLLEHAHLPLPALATMFGCPALPFEASAFCNRSAHVETTARRSARFAVAFGLALREVLP